MNKGIFGGKYKVITFSFDDGNLDDVPLINLLNKYGLKSTFNLNSGLLTENNCWTFAGQKQVRHLNYTEMGNLYDGHEIAAHSYTHPDLTKLCYKDIQNQIAIDKKILEALFDQTVEGFAYPMGTFNEDIGQVLKENNILYGRTTVPTRNFDLPENPIFWHPTCHFMDERIEELAEQFLKLEDTNAVFYIWGHSYEPLTEEQWDRFERLCQLISNKEDTAYLTNIEIIKAINNAEI